MTTDYKITRLRSVAITIVVFGHSIILYDPQWELYKTVYTVDLLMWIKRIINTFQMPLFLFLSGFCFFYSIKRHDYHSVKSVIKGIEGKAKRLLVPFFVIAIVWMIPIRLLCRYNAWSGLKYSQIIKLVFLGFDSGHLWFLPTLFLIFVFAFIVFPYVSSKSIDFLILLISFLEMMVIHKAPALLFLKNVISSLYWFCLGFEVSKYNKIFGKNLGIKINYGIVFLSGTIILLTIRGGEYIRRNAKNRCFILAAGII